MPSFVKSTAKTILPQCPKVNKSWPLCLLTVSVIVLLVILWMYSHSSVPVMDTALHQTYSHTALVMYNSTLEGKGPKDTQNRTNINENLKSPELLSDSNDTVPPQSIQQNNEVNKALPNFHNDSCPTVHVVMIIVGYNESRSSFLAIKSILMYRQAKLHFHFIADTTAQTILGPMMSSWLLPGVDFVFYNITEAWSSTPWSKGQLCSKELLKVAALHLVLPHEIDAVVVVDPHLIITASLFEIFGQTLMDLRQKGRLIALSSEECTIECDDGSVIQRNRRHDSDSTSGVMVLNLAGMRSSISWRSIWDTIKSEPPDCKHVSSVSSLDTVRKVCATLRCDWSTYGYLPSSTPDKCWASLSVFEQQLNSSTLRETLKHIQKYDGYELRFKEKGECYKCDPKLKKPPFDKNKCTMLKWEGATKRRMYPYLLGSKYTSSDPHDVTMVVHLTIGRMHLIEEASKHWDGPMSIAIHMTDSEVQQLIDFVLKSELLSQRKDIAYHILFIMSRSYPINPLRILGHRFVTTPHVFFNDADFIPSYGLYDNLKDIIKNSDNMTKTALIVPAFETDKPDLKYPINKQEMVDMIQRELVRQFHKRSFSPGHAPTDYGKWAKNTTTSPYTVKWKQSFEPYIAVKTSVVPFDPRFVSRQHNKISHTEELHMAGYQFVVVHNGFLIHMPHPVVKRSELYTMQCYMKRYHEWQREKQKQYAKH